MTKLQYFKNTAIVGSVVGIVYSPMQMMMDGNINLLTIPGCMLSFILAIVIVDFAKGKKIFAE